MSQSGDELVKMIEYMKAHWPSKVKDEWQVELREYPEILKKVIEDFTAGRTQGGMLMRIAGLSGSGKTTQLLPAVEAYAEKLQKKPILVAARKFVDYHPHKKEIVEFYGEKDLRKMTDEFSTILMFMTLKELIAERYDIILDVTLLDPEMEAILTKMLKTFFYESLLTMVAVSPEVTEKFLAGREWRHTKETEQEFIRATEKAMEFYANEMPEMRIVLWNTYETAPVYDGEIKNVLSVFKKYSSEETAPEHDEELLREAKIKYLTL